MTEALQQELDSVQAELEEANDELDDLHREHDELITKYDSTSTELSSVKSELADHEKIYQILSEEFSRSQQELLDFKKSADRQTAKLERTFETLRQQLKGKNTEHDKLAALLSVTLTGGNLHESMEVHIEMNRLNQRIKDEELRAITAEDALAKETRMFELQLQKMRSKLAKATLQLREDASTGSIKKELSIKSAQLVEVELELATLKTKYNALVESQLEKQTVSLDASFSIGDIDSMSSGELVDRQEFVNQYIAGVLEECGYDAATAGRIQARMNDFSEGWWSVQDLISACSNVADFSNETLAFSGKKSHPANFDKYLNESKFFQEFSDKFGGK